MIATLILLVFAGVTLVLFLVRLPASAAKPGDELGIPRRLQTVDLEAFRNLVDPDEEQFLRENLPVRDFRDVQRKRLRAAVDYVSGVSDNAVILLRVGFAARRSPDPRIAEAGRELVDNALQLRLFSLMAIGKLYARIVFPGRSLETLGLASRYQETRDCATLLGRLQQPNTSRVVSSAS
jgi:hypothetical protein